MLRLVIFVLLLRLQLTTLYEETHLGGGEAPVPVLEHTDSYGLLRP